MNMVQVRKLQIEAAGNPTLYRDGADLRIMWYGDGTDIVVRLDMVAAEKLMVDLAEYVADARRQTAEQAHRGAVAVARLMADIEAAGPVAEGGEAA